MTPSTLCDDFPTLTGRQEPHHLSVFPGDAMHGGKAVELARRAGAMSMPWQRSAQLSICATTDFGRWVHPTFCVLCARQNGKSEILIHRCLYGLFKLTETILFTAQRWKTARDAWRRLMALIKGRPWLRKHVVKSTCSQGEGVIELDTGAAIYFGTRSNDTGRGLTDVDLLIYDEAYNLTDGEVAALAFTQMAAPNPQRIYASSAVNQAQHPNGLVLSSVRSRGIRKEPRLGFMEFWAPDGSCDCPECLGIIPMARDDEATWEYANPSYGVIMTAEKIADIMDNLQTEAGQKAFDVEALGRGDWPQDKQSIPAVIPAKVWEDMADRDQTLVGTVAMALSMTPLSPGRAQKLSIAVASHTTDSRIHIEVGYHDVVTGAVAAIKGIVARLGPCALVIDSTDPAMSLVPELLAADIEPETTSAAQKVAACGGFYQDAVDAKLVHTGDPLLADAVGAAGRREVKGGGWAWQGAGLSPLEAATLARWGLLTFGARALPPALPPAAVPAERTYIHTGDLMVAGF
ncbi:hypothetical protein ACFXG7_37475 [Nocardia tengchongensis]|uniref:hypothetical protein n=1 Tax=Nocardia tengchongensis TaxID=2055889 RepID=UPI00367926E0